MCLLHMADAPVSGTRGVDVTVAEKGKVHSLHIHADVCLRLSRATPAGHDGGLREQV